MEPKRSSDIDLLTLAIAAAAGAAAAYVTSQFWAGGTLVTAALTPVIVALVKEGLSRPAERLQTIRTARHEEPVETGGHRWKVALVSAAAAFALIVGVFTIPELVAGESIGRGGDSGTTLFGGEARKKQPKTPAAPAKDDTAPTPEATEEPEETPTPEETEAPEPTPSPAPTAAPTTTVLAIPTP